MPGMLCRAVRRIVRFVRRLLPGRRDDGDDDYERQRATAAFFVPKNPQAAPVPPLLRPANRNPKTPAPPPRFDSLLPLPRRLRQVPSSSLSELSDTTDDGELVELLSELESMTLAEEETAATAKKMKAAGNLEGPIPESQRDAPFTWTATQKNAYDTIVGTTSSNNAASKAVESPQEETRTPIRKWKTARCLTVTLPKTPSTPIPSPPLPRPPTLGQMPSSQMHKPPPVPLHSLPTSPPMSLQPTASDARPGRLGHRRPSVPPPLDPSLNIDRSRQRRCHSFRRSDSPYARLRRELADHSTKSSAKKDTSSNQKVHSCKSTFDGRMQSTKEENEDEF